MEAHRERLEEEKEQAHLQDKYFMANIQRLTEAYGDKPRKPLSVYKPKGTLYNIRVRPCLYYKTQKKLKKTFFLYSDC